MYIHALYLKHIILQANIHTDHCFNLAMRKSRRLITQLYEQRLKRVGLKVGSFQFDKPSFFKTDD